MITNFGGGGSAGERSSKRPKIQELHTTTIAGAGFRELEPEKMDDEWEELDESAMEECMVLATQMCSQLPEDESSLNQRIDDSHENNITAKTFPSAKNQANKTPRHVLPSYNNAAMNFDDSGFSSVRSNSLNTGNSRLASKNARTVCNQPGSLPKTSYANRFNDFTIPINNSHKSSSGSVKPVHGSGKVYNSIPMKSAGGIVNSGKGYIQPSCPSGRAVSEDNQQGLLKRLQIEKTKLEEDVLLKQGEISLLRSEMKRKEAALEAERLDRCAAIEAAEKRGKEKVANVAAEAEAKTKERVRIVEKLQGELLFKNREIEELVVRCRQLEQQTQQHVPSQSHGTPIKRCRSEVISPKVSPSKLHSNFASRFDFGGSRVSVRNVEIQTESSYSKTKVRRRLNVAAARGGGRRAAYLLSASGSAPSMEGQAATNSYDAKHWSLPCEWSYLTSQIITEKDSVNVEKRLMALAVERLQEVHTLISSKEAEDNRSPVTRPISPLEWYEGQVVPALHVIGSFASPHNITEEPKVLQIISAHLSPLHIKEVLVNNRICCVILQTMEKIASFVSSPNDKVVCEQVIVSLKDCLANINTDREHLPVLKALVAVAPHTSLTSLMCTTAGSCLVGKLCSTIDKMCTREVATVSELLKWVKVLVEEPPPWLQSNCICPSQLLATLLKQIYQALDYTHSERGYEKKVYRLLLSCVRVLHRWSTVDPEWWEKVAHLPHYTALMGTIITNARDIQPDRQTVDLLCDLYEVDEGTFDGY